MDLKNEKKINQIRALQILSHDFSKESYTLPEIGSWDKEVCEAINHIPIGIGENHKGFQFSNPELFNNKEINKHFSAVNEIFGKETCLNICKYEDLEVDYVRFYTNSSNNPCIIIILREESEDIARNCADSIKKGLDIYSDYQKIKQAILLSNDNFVGMGHEKIQKECDKIKYICALGNHFNPNKSRTQEKVGNDILNELLQNANDRICDGKMTLEVTDNELILEYHESIGFTLKDFLAISTYGNSGNVDDSKKGDDRVESVGNKGTGFKCIYNVFQKVFVESIFKDKKITCTLDDTKFSEIKDFKNMDIFFHSKKDEEHSFHYPVPEFTVEEKEDVELENMSKTRITLIFKPEHNCSKKEEYKILKGLNVEKFEESKKFLFLDNISEFIINKKKFNKEEYLKKYFVRHESNFDMENEFDDLKKSTKYKNIDYSKFIEKKLNKITLLFPKNPKYPDLVEHITSPFYCGLPLSDKKKYPLPFYVNCIAFKVNDERKNLDENNDWNKYIWKRAITDSNSALVKVFNEFAKEFPDIAYRYFPYKHLKEWESVKHIKYIRVVTDLAAIPELMSFTPELMSFTPELMSFNDYIENKFVFLPNYMYSWFFNMTEYDSDFSYKKPFVYYPKQNNIEIIYNGEWMHCFAGINFSIKTNFSEFESYFTKKLYENVEHINRLKNDKYLCAYLEWVNEFIEAPQYSDSEISKEDKFIHFIRWTLGQSICESKNIHSLKLNEGYIKVDDYQSVDDIFKNLKQYIEKYVKHKDGAEGIKALYEQDHDQNLDIYHFQTYYENCSEKIFPQLRAYLFKKDKKTDAIVSAEDPFLNKVLEKNDKEKIYNIQESELASCCSYNEGIKELLDASNLVVRYGENGKYKYCRGLKNGIYYSRYIYDQNIITGPEFLLKHDTRYDICNLDKKIIEKRFLEETTNQPILYRWIALYLFVSKFNDKNEICRVIQTHIENVKDVGEKEKNLFYLLYLYHKYDWKIEYDQKYKELLSIYLDGNLSESKECLSKNDLFVISIPENNKYYKKENNTICLTQKISFSFDKKNVIPPYVKERFKDKVNITVQESEWLFGNSNIKLNEIVENHVKVYKNSSGIKEKFMIAKSSSNIDLEIILFGEKYFGLMLKELFGCDEYITPKTATNMDCYLSDSLMMDDYDNWDKSDFDKGIHKRIMESLENVLKTSSDKNDVLKHYFSQEYEFRDEEGKWKIFKGYGSDDHSTKCCPVCNGNMICELTGLRVKNVLLTSGYSFEVLLCSNCAYAFQYAEDVYFVYKDDQETDYKRIDDLNKQGESVFNKFQEVLSNPKQKIAICFDMYRREKKYYEVDMPFLHRFYLYRKIVGIGKS